MAVKVVRANLAIHDRFRARFSREVALAASVVHPHVVPVLDHGRLPDGLPFVAMAYANRGSFAELLTDRPPLLETLGLVDQVLSALAGLHARGLIHQDLKPENVLLVGESESASRAWVADLGVAGAQTELAMARRGIAGTPGWMAPEQLLGRPQEIGPWTDLYGVGLLLNQVLGGEQVAVDRRARTIEDLERPKVYLPDEVPDALDALVRGLLDPDPRQRFDRAADVRRVLAQAIAALSADHPLIEREEVADLPSTTTFTRPILSEAREPITIPFRRRQAKEVPQWRRVSPTALPTEPPPPAGLGEIGQAPPLIALREPPPVGQWTIIKRIWDAARAVVERGEPRVLLLVGRSDSGKTSLATWVARVLEEGGWMESVSLRYHSPPAADDGYYGAVQEILAPWNDTRFEAERRLARWLARDQRATREEVAGEAAVLARWCGYVRKSEQPVNGAVGLTFLFRHLDARAWRGGACMVLEDVHSASQAGDGLAICGALLEETVGQRPVLAIATVGAEAVWGDPVLSAKLDGLVELGAERVEVPRLSLEQTTELLVDGVGLAPELAALVAPRCGGSPPFVSLLLRDWAQRGLLQASDEGPLRLREGVDIDVVLPTTIDELCARRVDGALAATEVPAGAAEALAASALAGQAPPAVVVRNVNHEGLDRLLATGLVRQRGFRLEFEHPAIHALAVRRAEVRADVQVLQGQLADAWERLGRYTGTDVDLAHGRHRLRSDASDRAVAPLLRASRSALAAGRHVLALTAARLALDAAGRSGVRMAQVEARQRVAEALLELDRPAESRAALAEITGPIDRLSGARNQVLNARAAIALGELEEGRRLLDAAATTYEATRDWRGLVDTSHGQGTLHRLAGRPIAAMDRYTRMLRINRGGDMRAEVVGLAGLVECGITAGHLSGVEQDVARLRKTARQSGDTRNIAKAMYVSGLVHLRHRRYVLAERHFQTTLALAATEGDDRQRVACENALGEVFRYRGDLNAATRSYRRAARVANENGWSSVAAVARLNLALVAMQSGREDLTRTHVEAAQALLTQHREHWAWLFVALMLALWAAQDGDEATCRSWWQVAQDRGLGRVTSPDLWIPLERLSTAAAQQGWRDLAKGAQTIAARSGVGDSRGGAVSGVGVDVEVVEDPDDAATALD